MRDGIIKGTGNSRYLKTVSDALTRWPTYDSFMRAMVAGTFLADLYGLNSAGWQDVGTTINKSSLLSDATANAIGTAGEIDTPDKALAKLRQLVQTAQSGVDGGVKMAIGSYVGTGKYGASNPNSLSFSFAPKALFMYQANGLEYEYQVYNQAGTAQGGLTAALTTSYQNNVLFAMYTSFDYKNHSGLYTKKSSNGRVITWYAVYQKTNSSGPDEAASISYQMNNQGVTYRYLALA